ncbi:hypothetical protein [Hymenobacter sp. BT491]|uniref:hypothetical protein n=1 Tax=Hymenobacter sp. BT491 TaxID=2766779 RepID=UPI0016534C85|nr:hypothetical protein [Hymenobacter sp. BT491]MBC6991739.1 hypothetical protein [Hymenobacter sp. BT491]
MRFDRALWRTILFSLAVVALVIGVYQTVLQGDKNAVMDNYWLFMISFVCMMVFRYLGRDEDKAPLPVAKPKPAASGKRTATTKPGKAVLRNKQR